MGCAARDGRHENGRHELTPRAIFRPVAPVTSSKTVAGIPRLRLSKRLQVRPLDPARYALTHAVYEAASDQRQRLRDWLIEALPPRLDDIVDRPLRVLGVGVGDGSVDAPLAAALARQARPLHYEGVEPHAASARRFVAALEGLEVPNLHARATISDFAQCASEGQRDLIHFIHSLYYVADLGAAIDQALGLLRPGGWLVALQSPRAPLSEVAATLTARAGCPQCYAEDLEAQLAIRGLSATTATIDACLDIDAVYSDPAGAGEQLLDFLTQVRSCDLDATTRDAVLDYLRQIADPDHPTRLPHPVTAVLVRRTGLG
jgi:SAM-dependent methyltransferase